MPAAAALASAADFTSFTPPALPRPPACTCALTTATFDPSSSYAFAAPSASCASRPRSTGTPYFASSSFAWYSWIFTGPPGERVPAGATRAPASVQQPLLLQQPEVLADRVGRVRERL